MSVDSNSLWLAIGWTMLHFFWVGGLIGIGTAVALRLVRGALAEVRYAIALTGLAVLALAPAAIGWRASLSEQAGGRVRPGEAAALPAIPLALGRQDEEWSRGITEREPSTAPAAPAVVPVAGRQPHPPGLAARLDELAAWLPWIWLVGSPLTFAWLALGLVGAERLRRQSDVVTDGELPRLCRRLRGELAIARDVAVAVCERLATPVLVGVVRPMILLPAAALGCWSPEQIEMVLLHELAHVRRWDNLVNLFQRLVESALFFHPAVWIVSGWVRREREHCCDGVVVSRTGRARAYAETLLALAVPDPDRASRAAVAMTRNHLVSRIRQILAPREEHPMKLSRRLIVAAGAVVVAPTFWIAALGQSQPAQQDQANQKPATVEAEEKKAGKPPLLIQGKPLPDWIAALKEPDPAVRKRALDVLGDVTRAQAGDEFFAIEAQINGALFNDKDPGVRRAAGAASSRHRMSTRSDAMRRRMVEEQKRFIPPTLTPLRLVDALGRPVAGAVVSTVFTRDRDKETSFIPSDAVETKRSDTKGEIALMLSIGGHQEGDGVYAIRQEADLPIVGLHKVTREEIGKPVTIVMHPACRVRFRVECPGFRELEEKYHAELGGPNWWRAAYLMLGDDSGAPRPLFTCSTTGELEFLLPPGRFTVTAYGSDANNVDRPVTIESGHRVLSLGTIDVPPNGAVKQGIFRNYWRSIQRDPHAGLDGHDDENRVVFRRPRRGTTPKGETRSIQDFAFSPDGKLMATAHWYNADPGEAKLWDAATGKPVASLPVPVKEGGVLELTFSPDGKTLAGSVGPLTSSQPPGVVVLWDVAGRRELSTLRGHTARIAALAFSPDGKILASGGEDKTVRFWDVSTGRETGRIEGNPGWVRSVAYAPDGKALAIGTGRTVKLWDVSGHRPRAMLEPDGFWVHAVAFASDGKALAAAGATTDARGNVGRGQVRLYDLTPNPPVRRAELTLDLDGPLRANRGRDFFSDVAFTPDGRRVAAVVMQTVVIWDAATGSEQDSLDRASGGSADRLAVTPDGRWLAVTGQMEPNISILEIGPPSS
jgi:WD40 repeat protein/beta-lactamase regulating signal transducer with metallopeptidase domain